MPKVKKGPLLVSWPDEDAEVKLNVIEEDEEPVSIHDIAFDLMVMYWGTEADFGEEGGVEFAEIIYPNRIRFYYNGKRIGLSRAHTALESGLNKALRIALDFMDQQLKNEEASHSQV